MPKAMKCSVKVPGKSPGLKAKEICQDIVERKVEIFNSFSVTQHINIHEQLRENFLNLNKNAYCRICDMYLKPFPRSILQTQGVISGSQRKRLLQGNRRHQEFDLDMFCTR